MVLGGEQRAALSPQQQREAREVYLDTQSVEGRREDCGAEREASDEFDGDFCSSHGVKSRRLTRGQTERLRASVRRAGIREIGVGHPESLVRRC